MTAAVVFGIDVGGDIVDSLMRPVTRIGAGS